MPPEARETAAAETRGPAAAETLGAGAAARELADERERTLALWITNASHAVNHFQNQMVSVLYPVMMAELGFGYAQLGVLSAIRSMLGSGTQVLYGFLAPFVRRPLLLAAGNGLVTAGSALSAAATGYPALVAARAVAATGMSAQHPVGSSLLASYFPRRVATVLALNTGIAGIGSLVAPLAAALLLLVMGWREIFLVVGAVTGLVAIAYLLVRGRIGGVGARTGSAREKLASGWASYVRALRNRNIVVVSLVMMVGAAGRGEGVNVAYMGPHFVNDLLLSTVVAGVALSLLQAGGIVGPIGFAWLSDRLSRRGVIQASLILSALSTFWIARVGAEPLVLLPSMLFYGAVVQSRNPLTQALVVDSLDDADRDAAFSLYYSVGFVSAPVWTLLTGSLMEAYGFTAAFSLLSASYLAGAALLFWLDERRISRRPAEEWSEPIE